MYSFSNLFRIPKPDISRLGQKLIKSYSSWGQPPSCKNHSAFMDLCWCCWKMKFIPQDNFGLNTELGLGWNWSPATSASLSLKAKWLRSCIISSQAQIRKLENYRQKTFFRSSTNISILKMTKTSKRSWPFSGCFQWYYTSYQSFQLHGHPFFLFKIFDAT